MPFGLTNAPSTFQALMNDVLRSFIRKFVLVFFDNILVFSRSWSKHLQHVKQVFQALRAHKLSLKKTKCSFGEEKVVYFSHIISAAGVAMDPTKVEAVESWLPPRSLRALRDTARLLLLLRRYSSGRLSSGRQKLRRRSNF
jgi:hypothetical protein